MDVEAGSLGCGVAGRMIFCPHRRTPLGEPNLGTMTQCARDGTVFLVTENGLVEVRI